MKALRRFSWTKGEKAVACDFDHTGRLAALLRAPSDELRLEIDGTAYPLPADWAAQVARVRWMGESEALLWPVDFSPGKTPHVGKIGPNGTTVLDLDYPLEVFSDLDVIACTYSEEHIGDDSGLISIFLPPKLLRIARFMDDFMASFKEPRPSFFEVEHGVLDGFARRLWFSAYITEYLWCFCVDSPRLLVCELGCRRDEIAAITCRADQASVIVRKQNGFGIRTYKHLGDRLIFESQTEAPSRDTLWHEVSEGLKRAPGELRGHTGNMIALTTEASALLAEI